MHKNSAKTLARLLRLLACRLEEDPGAVIAFLGNESISVSANKNTSTKSLPKETATTGSFDPLKFLVDNQESEEALKRRLKRFSVRQLRALIAQNKGRGGNKLQKTTDKTALIAHIAELTRARLNRGRAFD